MEYAPTKLDEELKLWIEEKLVPKLKLVLNQAETDTKYEILPSSVPLIMSSLFFLEITFSDNEKEKLYSLVVKRPPRLDYIREVSQSDDVFHNEILFYNKYAKKSEVYPRCFFTLEEPPVNSVLVLENINKRGYYICPQKVNLDIKYVLAAMQEIGRFHAKAYFEKNKRPREFFEIVDNIREARYKESETNLFPNMINFLLRRIIKRLREENYEKIFCDKAEVFFNNAFENVIKAARDVELPLATLCHGDFTSNNIFFKESGLEVKGMLFDFAMITFGSPTIDISTFMFLNVKREDRKNRFKEIFDAYHDSLTDYLKDSGCENLDQFSKERFLEDYRRHALFGYLIACFFLPILHGVETPNFEDAKTLSSEAMERLANIGGDEFTVVLTEMLLDMRESGCLDHVYHC